MSRYSRIAVTVGVLCILLMAFVGISSRQQAMEETIVYLDGGWQYFRDLSLTQKDITEARMNQAQTIELPDYFKKSLFSDLVERNEHGTLYKKLTINEKFVGNILGIRVPYFPRGSKVFINGKELSDNNPGELTPHTLYFQVNQKDLDIIIHFDYSNKDFWVGKGIGFGLASDMERDTFSKDAMNLTLTISIVILLIYHSFFYARNQMRGKIWNILVFSVIILFKSLTFSQNSLMLIFNQIPIDLYDKLIYISIYTYFPALILMIDSLQPSRINKHVIDLSIYYLLFNIIVVLITPFSVVALLIFPSVIYVSYLAYDMVRSFVRSYRKTENKMIFLVAFFLVILMLVYLFEILYFSNVFIYKYHILIGMILFIILEASYMFYTYSEAFVELNELEERNKDMSIRFNAFNRDYQELLNQFMNDDTHFEVRKNLDIFLGGLDHVYFYMDQTITMSPMYSKNVKDIFKNFEEHELVTNLLFPNNMDDKLYFETIVGKIFNSNNAKETQLFINLMPKEVFIKDRYYDTYFHMVHKDEDKYIYCKLVDQSKKNQMCAADKNEVEALKMTVAVMSNIEDFYFYMEEYNKFCTVDIYRIMTESNQLKQTIYELLRHIHSYKSIFSRFDMQMTVKLLHSIETEILEILEDVDQLDFSEFKEIMLGYDLLSFLEKDLKIIENMSGFNISDEKHIIKVEKTKIDAVIQKILQVNKVFNLDEILMDVKRLKYIKLNKMFVATRNYIYSMADKKEKAIDQIEINIEEIEVDSRRFGSFVKSLNQVISNIIEHGIETPKEREAKGKPRGGSISITGKADGQNLLIIIKDDGKGIDVNRMKDQLFKENKMTFDELINASETLILSKLFDEGFSSKEDVDELSGRGLGLYDVKKELLALGGQYKVSTVFNQYTQFEFSIPMGEKS